MITPSSTPARLPLIPLMKHPFIGVYQRIAISQAGLATAGSGMAQDDVQ
jgi:hypothetical protein